MGLSKSPYFLLSMQNAIGLTLTIVKEQKKKLYVVILALPKGLNPQRVMNFLI